MINERIAALREQMQAHDLAAYIVLGTDPHQSEYMAARWQSREWISGFDGSAGTVVITKDFAGLWTDGRYFIQAEEQLASSEMQLMKLSATSNANHITWLAENLSAGDKVGVARDLLTLANAQYAQNHFQPSGVILTPMQDLLDVIWQDRPASAGQQAFEHELRYAGESRTDKIARIVQHMQQANLDYHLITALDDLAWTLNIRGCDVDYNPVVTAYALIGLHDCHLFIADNKLPDALRKNIEADGITIADYDKLGHTLAHLAKGKRIGLDPNQASVAIKEQLATEVTVAHVSSIPANLKACKNEIEAKHIRQSMEKDGVAMVRLFRWLEQAMQTGTVTETDVQDQLHQIRAQQEGFVSDSFHAISAYGPHAAIAHYRATQASSITLEAKGLFLLDSGGQYYGGTTDITRTVAMGKLTEEEKQDYTLVLQGHIALASISFHEGATGGHLDILARKAMWEKGIDYGHGTGHGVGFFLNVHEGPQGIAQGTRRSMHVALQPGMLTSNEPGIYRPGKHGIRIENLILCKQAETTEFGTFLHFETVTLAPIDTRPIVTEMLSQAEKTWLNQYHQEVLQRLQPYLEKDEVTWLEEKCQAI
ncbi:MAG: aminopeptidase P family protein [Deltaproteobacteria bacterium]|nr:aminopeptidase P family protein [Deltaproteobacteria bacterium]